MGLFNQHKRTTMTNLTLSDVCQIAENLSAQIEQMRKTPTFHQRKSMHEQSVAITRYLKALEQAQPFRLKMLEKELADARRKLRIIHSHTGLK